VDAGVVVVLVEANAVVGSVAVSAVGAGAVNPPPGVARGAPAPAGGAAGAAAAADPPNEKPPVAGAGGVAGAAGAPPKEKPAAGGAAPDPPGAGGGVPGAGAGVLPKENAMVDKKREINQKRDMFAVLLELLCTILQYSAL
jgi:hypothetical protein